MSGDVFRADSALAERAPETTRYAKGVGETRREADYGEVVDRREGLGLSAGDRLGRRANSR